MSRLACYRKLEPAMNRSICRPLGWVILTFLILIPVSLRAQLTPSPTQASTTQPGPNTAQQTAPPNLQAVSQTGLLPLFAVDMQVDPSWIDGTDVPSRSPQYGHSGVNDT